MTNLGPYTLYEEEYDIVRDLKATGASPQEIQDALDAYKAAEQGRYAAVQRNRYLAKKRKEQAAAMRNRKGLLSTDWTLQDPNDADTMVKYIQAIFYKIENRLKGSGEAKFNEKGGFGGPMGISVSVVNRPFISANETGWMVGKSYNYNDGTVRRNYRVVVQPAGPKKYLIGGYGQWEITNEPVSETFEIPSETKDLRWDLDKDGFAVLATIQKKLKQLDSVGSKANFWKWGSSSAPLKQNGTHFKKGEQFQGMWR